VHGLREDPRRRRGGRARRGRGETGHSRAAGGRARSARPWEPGVKAVGASLPRYDGVAHVTGRSQFVDDVRVPNMLWGKALRSPLPHAGIAKLDTKKAAAVKGVRAVVTWEDVPLLVYGHLSALGIPGDE